MGERAVLLVLAGLSILVARPSWAQAPVPTGPPPTFHFTVRAVDVRPPPGVADRAGPAPPSSVLPAAMALHPIPKFGLWSSVLDRAVAEFDALNDVSATAISAILQPAPIDALIAPQPGPWMAEGTPPEAPTGVTIGAVRLQPVAILSPAPVSTDSRGEQLILPSAVLELPWMVP